MPPMRCNVFHHSCTIAWACTKLCMMCMTGGIYMAVLYYHDIRMNMLSFQAMEVIFMRTTTDRSELGVASLVRTSCVIYRPA